jgi:ABC-type lipoprotein release transport system permease subunit
VLIAAASCSRHVNLPEILTISGIVLAIAARGSSPPASKASRMQPVDALGKGWA